MAQFRILQSPFDRPGDQSAEQCEQCKRTVGLSVRDLGAVSFGDSLEGSLLGSGLDLVGEFEPLKTRAKKKLKVSKKRIPRGILKVMSSFR